MQTLQDKYKFVARPDYRSDYYEPETLTDYDLERLEEQNITKAFYWYGAGNYCDTGNMIYLHKEKWKHHDMGHCSCYGSTSDIVANCKEGFETLQELSQSMSEELRAECHWLFVEALK